MNESLPLVYAHRGARDVAPENTLSAFRAAIQAGADGIECDITRCASGEIVVIHDDTVNRTTDGSGMVSELPLTMIKQLDAGSWFAPAFSGEHIPALVELLDLIQNKIRVNIEIKGMSTDDDGVEVEVAAMLSNRSLQQTVIVSSFNPSALERMHQAAPQIPCALLYTRDSLPSILLKKVLKSIPLRALHPQVSIVDQEYVEWAHQVGYLVNVWTVNESAMMEKMIHLGVDGIITDHPALLRRLLASC